MKSTLVLISSLVLPQLVTHYSLILKLYKLFVERNKTVCPGPISFLKAAIFLSLNTRHFKSFSLYDPGRNGCRVDQNKLNILFLL